jgi:hypothetical protein
MCPSSGETTVFIQSGIPPCINTVISPDDGHIVARNLYRKEINLLREIVHPFGFIYKILCKTSSDFDQMQAFGSNYFMLAMCSTFSLMSDRASPIIEQLIFFHEHTLIIILIIIIRVFYTIIRIIQNKQIRLFILEGLIIETT